MDKRMKQQPVRVLDPWPYGAPPPAEARLPASVKVRQGTDVAAIKEELFDPQTQVVLTDGVRLSRLRVDALADLLGQNDFNFRPMTVALTADPEKMALCDFRPMTVALTADPEKMALCDSRWLRQNLHAGFREVAVQCAAARGRKLTCEEESAIALTAEALVPVAELFQEIGREIHARAADKMGTAAPASLPLVMEFDIHATREVCYWHEDEGFVTFVAAKDRGTVIDLGREVVELPGDVSAFWRGNALSKPRWGKSGFSSPRHRSPADLRGESFVGGRLLSRAQSPVPIRGPI